MKYNRVIISCFLIISCFWNFNDSIKGENLNNIKQKNDSSESVHQRKEDSVRKAFYGYDTLVIKKYVTKNGIKIKLEGSKSKDVYRIVATNKQGITKTFKIADNWYVASHSYILWCNNDFIFINDGCGTDCWTGEALSLNDDRGILYFDGYFCADSAKNIVVYPGTINSNTIPMKIENLITQKEMSVPIKVCDSLLTTIDMVNGVYFDKQGNLILQYKGEDCRHNFKTIINKKQIEKLSTTKAISNAGEKVK